MPNLFLGDSLDVLKTLPENSIDSLVTDPPYFLTGSSGSGFMGKSWDSLSLENAIVESYFKLMKIVLDMDEASTVLERVNTLKSESPALSAKNQSSQLPLDFVPALVLTKQEALVLCREMLPNHTTAVEKLPNHALFVGQPFNIKTNTPRSIVRIIVGILQEEPEWLEQTTIFTSTEKTESEKSSTEEKSGTLLESQSTLETNTVAESVGQNAQNTTYNATMLCPIEFQTTILKIISLPCVKAVIKQCTSSQNLIPLLSEAFHYKWAKEVLRVLKPGAHGLVFGGTRTYHRLVSSLEDAGFEIRDCVMWLHGQGFPKSLSVSKQLEKQGYPEEAEKWSGYGTALKPSYEPIVLIRRPLSEKTVAANVLKHGCGGLNIDASRISPSEIDDYGRSAANSKGTVNAHDGFDGKAFKIAERSGEYASNLGRFPSHLVLDEEAASLPDEQVGDLGKSAGGNSAHINGSVYGKFAAPSDRKPCGYGDKGSASRFFYVAKASKSDKNFGLDGMDLIWESDVWEKQVQNLLMENINLLPKDISDDQLTASKQWSTDLFGNNISEQSPTGLMYTIETVLKLITELKTLNSSQSSRIKESTQDAIRMINRNGLSLAKSVEFLNQWKPNTTKDQTEYTLGVVLAFAQVLKQIMSYAKSGNFHNTVKSTKLMEYLIKLITPPNGVVLDCFAGSGSTGVAALRAGFQFIGIEKEPEYFEIATKRLSAMKESA